MSSLPGERRQKSSTNNTLARKQRREVGIERQKEKMREHKRRENTEREKGRKVGVYDKSNGRIGAVLWSIVYSCLRYLLCILYRYVYKVLCVMCCVLGRLSWRLSVALCHDNCSRSLGPSSPVVVRPFSSPVSCCWNPFNLVSSHAMTCL